MGFYLNLKKTKHLEKITIFDFENNGIDSETAKTLTDRLRNELVKFDKIEIVERKRIYAVFLKAKNTTHNYIA